ncbi:thioredoxin family protein [Actinoallomurus iriomotensis]|uniref:Thiol reductase thioredoxin n=1 Tax=Actinoallomurus iriomotensis TaxID=478107 RepID=A0A9W6RX34_9ACTN|nr:thioredoxin family protein [Actinoallomurus iriomotensis]GLY74764.1 thiol reductase thioredoxin [Actinoallomurus iriomotensis]GLY83625.1 thiol reductase thioredoxin [Actinoallomurus iriomotensis]
MIGLYVALAALVLATALGLVWRSRNGVLRERPERKDGEVERLGETELGTALGPRATLVQFSSAFCAPCRATRRILTEVTDLVDGVAHVEIDAESHLDLVRRLNVLRTPTVFVLNADGEIVRRGSGLPRKADIVAALGQTVA